MKLFIDSANIREISEACSWRIIDGVTTNPTSIAKEGKDLKKTICEICAEVRGPVSVEAMESEPEKIVKEARTLAKWHKNVVIKIPCTFKGLIAVRKLQKYGIRSNVTLVFSPNQVLLAAKAGAAYISPFVGRLDDAGEDGLAVVSQSLEIIKNYSFKSQIIVASVRSPEMVVAVARMGAPIATIPFKILEKMIEHPLTEAGIQRFLQDWKRS